MLGETHVDAAPAFGVPVRKRVCELELLLWLGAGGRRDSVEEGGGGGAKAGCR
jgi:hypothetical protein